MNGIKLKNNELSPLKVERIKWMILLLLSHLFVFLLVSLKKTPIRESIPKVKAGFVRLELPIISQVALDQFRKKVILMTENQYLVTAQAELIKKISRREGIDSAGTQYLVDLPEADLENLIKIKKKDLFAYPATKSFRPKKKPKTKEAYEIHF